MSMAQNVVVELRATDGSFDKLPRFAEELVRSKVDVILASAAPAVLAARKATTSVPIVFVGVLDPVGIGLVSRLGRPGGDITGLSTNAVDFAGKRLELLRAMVPRLKRVAVLWHPANPTNAVQLKGAQVAARTLGVQLVPVPVQGPNDLDSAVTAMRGTDGLLMLESPFFTTHRARLAELVARSRLPAIYGQREYVEAGALCHMAQTCGAVQACRSVRGQDLEGRKARRSPRRATHKVRAGDQHPDRQGPRPDDPTVAPAASRSGDRMIARARQLPAKPSHRARGPSPAPCRAPTATAAPR